MGLELLNREIFATGTHNGDSYTEVDLDEMVRAFNELDYRPALKLGHTDEPGHPAFGYIANLRRIGSKLIADFVDLTEGIYEAIKNRQYERVSAEIYWNFERAGKKFKRALKAVALLGAEVPAVAGLKPLHVFAAEAERHYDVELQEFDAAMAAAIEDYVKKGNGPHGKQWDALGGSHASCAERMAGKVDDPHAFCAWLEKQATGSGPSAKQHSSKGDTQMTAEQLKELTDNLAAVTQSLNEEKAKREASEKWFAEENAALSAKLAALQNADSGVDLSNILANLKTEEAKQEVKTLAARLQSSTQELEKERQARETFEIQRDELLKQNEALAKQQRNGAIRAVVEQCKLPAVRVFVAQYLDLATRDKDIKVYDEKGKPVDARGEAEKFIKFINENTLRLFRLESVHASGAEFDGDISKEVDVRTQRYMQDHKERDYAKAMHAVLDADPALKKAYAHRGDQSQAA